MMGLSYTEELVSEYFKHLMKGGRTKYVVSEKVKYRGPKGIGWSDIDILAIGDKDICIVETKHREYAGGSKKKMLEKYINSFIAARRFVKKHAYAKGKKIRKVFVATKGSKPFEKELRKHNIETRRLDEIVKELLKILRKRIYPVWPRKVRGGRGKEESNVARTLIMLLEDEFIKEEI